MYYIYVCVYGGPGSVVGTTIRYGLEGPGFESQWGGDIFHTIPDRPRVSPNFLLMGTGSFLGVMRPGRDADHPSHLAPRLMKQQSYTSTSPLRLRGLF